LSSVRRIQPVVFASPSPTFDALRWSRNTWARRGLGDRRLDAPFCAYATSIPTGRESARARRRAARVREQLGDVEADAARTHDRARARRRLDGPTRTST
jgi:hypothetical protein